MTLAWVCVLGVSATPGTVAAQFTGDNVSLHAHLDLAALGASGNGNDCWGYVSGSGREYALMGVSNQLVVVEITTPGSPVIVDTVPHADCLWSDVKVFGDHAYVVNECGGGMDIIDLSDVDNGNVTLVQQFTGNGLSTSHNVAIDTDSGFLYLCGPNINGRRLVAYDLTDPANPVLAGMMTSGNGGNALHDAQIVTYTSGPLAGRQICFGAGESRGVDVIDVTDKSNMVRLSRTTYPNLSYSHQCWLHEDRQYLYVNDETDGINETVVFDVSDLSNPVLINTYDAGVPATDHNLYTRGGFIYEADYHAGLRIFCADDPVNPAAVGWFDTYPPDDNDGFDGAWSVFPFFPSGTVIVSDFDRGLFILDVSAALSAGSLTFAYPMGMPASIDPAGGTSLRVEIDGACGATVDAGTGLLHYDIGGGFVTVPMSLVAGNAFDAVFPATPCGQLVQYYVSAQDTLGNTFTDPAGAPATTYAVLSAVAINTVFADDFETDMGWTEQNLGATAGDWQRGIPIDDPNWSYDPAADSDGSGQCWLTENLNNPAYPNPSNTDVDNGAVELTSPTIDMAGGGDVIIRYDYYLNLSNADGSDRLLVEINNNGGVGAWIAIASHDTNGGLNWRHQDIYQADLDAAGVTLTAAMKIRFTANDGGTQSIVEGGVDAFGVDAVDCTAACPPADGDMDELNGTNGDDIQLFVDAILGTPSPGDICHGDFSGNGTLGAEDVAGMVTLLLAP